MRILLRFIAFLFLLYSCSTPRSARELVVAENTLSPLQEAIVSYGMSYLNTPYRYAAKGPYAFDCSGFTSFIFRKFGYRLPASSKAQAQKYGKKKKKKLKVGDLVFFEGRRKNNKVGHVGMVTSVSSDGTFKFIHASVSKGVIVSSSSQKYYASRFLKSGSVFSSDIGHKIETEQNSFIYIVKKGDTLYKIAQKYGCTLEQLQSWNPDTDTLIHIGEELIIYK